MYIFTTSNMILHFGCICKCSNYTPSRAFSYGEHVDKPLTSIPILVDKKGHVFDCVQSTASY